MTEQHIFHFGAYACLFCALLSVSVYMLMRVKISNKTIPYYLQPIGVRMSLGMSILFTIAAGCFLVCAKIFEMPVLV